MGVLYHVNRPISLVESISSVNTDMLVIETALSTAAGSMFELKRENLSGLLNAVDSELVMVPTAKAVISMAELFGYRTLLLSFPTREEPVWAKHRYGVVQAFVCAKQSDLSDETVFPTRTLKSLYKDQERWSASRRPGTDKETQEAVHETTPLEGQSAHETGARVKPRRPFLRRARRFLIVWLRAAVRVRLQRLRRQG